MSQQGTSTFTLVEKAAADATDEHGGRFAKQQRPTVVGRTEDGADLPAPLWCQQQSLVGDEPPLGESVDWVPDQTTVSGQAREELEAPAPSLADTVVQLRDAIAEQQAVLAQLIAEAETQTTNEETDLNG
jgi:hypothetical protein